MERISIYDEEAKRIEFLATVNNTIEAEIIEALFTALDDNGIDLKDYL